MEREKILRILDETYAKERMSANTELNIKLLQLTQQFVSSFDYELPSASGLKGSVFRFIKRAIRKSTRFITKPYAEKMLKFQMSLCELLGVFIEKAEGVDKEIESLRAKSMEDNLEKTLLELHQECAIKNEMFNEKIVGLQQSIYNHEEAIYKLSTAFNDNANLTMELSDSNTQIRQYLFGDEKDERFRTYSQAGEDVIISFILGTLGEEKQGYSYLDIGCNRYRELNNTYHFYEKGMRGVLVDANPKFIEEARKARPGDTVLNIGVAREKAESLTFYVCNWDWLSSFNKQTIADVMKESSWIKIVQEIEVPVLTVNQIIEKYFHTIPTIISIDVEGDELPILESINMELYRPMIYIIETIEYREKIDLSNKRTDIIEYMQSQGYKEYAFTGINSIFLDSKQFS